MTKKVTLDTLDIEETSVSIREEHELVEEENHKLPTRWFASVWFRAFGIAVGVLSCIFVFSYWWLSQKEQVPPRSVSTVNIPVPLHANENIQVVNDFFIPLKAEKGKQKLVMLDLVFDLNAGQQGLFMQNIVRIRSTIYQTVNRKTDDVAVGPGSMNILKSEMMAELEKYLGKDMIKNIYFTRYIVL